MHTSTVHGRCPLNQNWDYYEVEIRTDGFIDVAALEVMLDSVRGKYLTQEDMAHVLRELIPADCIIVMRGRHSQNTTTMVEL